MRCTICGTHAWRSWNNLPAAHSLIEEYCPRPCVDVCGRGTTPELALFLVERIGCPSGSSINHPAIREAQDR
jgi:hypothetical protein